VEADDSAAGGKPDKTKPKKDRGASHIWMTYVRRLKVFDTPSPCRHKP
jgi:hypothetical protein